MTHSTYFTMTTAKKTNVAMLCWDAVATAVGITSCLNIAYAMFMYHVSFTCEKGKLRGAEWLGNQCEELRVMVRCPNTFVHIV